MTFDDFPFIGDGLRTCLSPYTLIIIPIIVLLVPNNYVIASCSFPAFRIQQYDLHGISYGSQSVGIGLEAKTLQSNNWVRKCVIIRLGDINGHLNDILAKAAGLILLIPGDSRHYTELEKETLYDMEQRMTGGEVNLPVYIIKEQDNYTIETFDNIMQTLKGKTDQTNQIKGDSALNEMLKAATANTYYVSYKSTEAGASSTYSTPLDNFELLNIQAKITGLLEEELPTVVIVTYYDAFALAPGLAFGCDSNGSGVAAFFELARILKMFYSNKLTLPKFNLVFLLSAGGKFNYLGSKKWINDQFENSDSSFISDIAFVLCLDAIGNGDSLHVHVSKPPKENTPIYKFIGHLRASAEALQGPGAGDSVVLSHKKINLAEETRAWEHERYGLRKVPAFTLSHFRDYFDPRRHTLLDIDCTRLVPRLTTNVKLIAESLVRFLYFPDEDPTNLSVNILENGSILADPYSVNVEHLRGVMETFSHYARAQQLFRKESHILSTIVTHFSDLVKDIRIIPFRTDKREPDFAFYDNFQGELTFYKSKPALFDLYLAILVGVYLGLLHLFLINFPNLCYFWTSFMRLGKKGNGTNSSLTNHQQHSTYAPLLPNHKLGNQPPNVYSALPSGPSKSYANGSEIKNGFYHSVMNGLHFRKI